ncbi:hypothetical protein P879_06840 [Paragonimus westermani]|uniref:Uncharacterized protein n=1 Tax=Paragonimus westermani TaxID=34504 RepID=A0A8T0DQA3_9TREM|nr:hypothetical protein P879_06840 [Paragonimus westermani]
MSVENGLQWQYDVEDSFELPKDPCISAAHAEESSDNCEASRSLERFQGLGFIFCMYGSGFDSEVAKILEAQDTCRLTNFTEMSKQLLFVRKELFGAVSNTERAEANRQAAELELTRVNLINRKLYLTCHQQQELLHDAEAELVRLKKMFETEVNKTNSMHNMAHGDWLKKESNLEDKLETMTNDLESLVSAS